MSPAKSFDAAVVVFSSDGYSDFWHIFFDFYFRNSGLGDLPIYLITDSKSHEHPNVKVINYPHLAGQPWSTRISHGLRMVPHDYVVVFTEDLLCTQPCSAENMKELMHFSLAQDVTCLRLVPFPPPVPRGGGIFSVLVPNSLHRVSLQPSIWNRNRLLSLMKEGETPWEFEINGSRRSRSDDAFYCANRPFLSYQEVIGRGRVTRKGARLIRNAGLGSYLKRSVYTTFQEIERDLSHMKARAFYLLPSSVQEFLIRRRIVGRAFHE